MPEKAGEGGGDIQSRSLTSPPVLHAIHETILIGQAPLDVGRDDVSTHGRRLSRRAGRTVQAGLTYTFLMAFGARSAPGVGNETANEYALIAGGANDVSAHSGRLSGRGVRTVPAKDRPTRIEWRLLWLSRGSSVCRVCVCPWHSG